VTFLPSAPIRILLACDCTSIEPPYRSPSVHSPTRQSTNRYRREPSPVYSESTTNLTRSNELKRPEPPAFSQVRKTWMPFASTPRRLYLRYPAVAASPADDRPGSFKSMETVPSFSFVYWPAYRLLPYVPAMSIATGPGSLSESQGNSSCIANGLMGLPRKENCSFASFNCFRRGNRSGGQESPRPSVNPGV